MRSSVYSFVSNDFEEWIYERTGGIVQSGPFRGMTFKQGKCWADGSLGPMLLGCHEEELHVPLEAEIARLSAMPSSKVVNVGCAEGYYAVGLARRLPKARVYAVDTEPKALAWTAEHAKENGAALLLSARVDQELLAGADLIVMDCEGEEVEYLDYEKFPSLLLSHIIVEIHQSAERPAGNILAERWGSVADLTCYYEAGRNPNNYAFLRNETSLMRWLSVCENRPCQMCYFVIKPRVDEIPVRGY